MWFKQVHIFQLTQAIENNPEALEAELDAAAFQPCLASHPFSYGWVPPIDKEGAPLVHPANGCLLICMQLEEKILPATVIRHELDKRIKDIASAQARRISKKEKMGLKEDITHTLLTKAFSKYSRVYAYFDTKNNWLVIDSAAASKVEKFLELLKRTWGVVPCKPVKTKKIGALLTNWLLTSDYPAAYSIKKSGVLSDPSEEKRVIRCQQQDLAATAIQMIIKEGCEVQQLALSWQDRINFTLTNEFNLKNISYSDELVKSAKDQYTETKEQQFDADALIMTESLSELLASLVKVFATKEKNKQPTQEPAAVEST